MSFVVIEFRVLIKFQKKRIQKKKKRKMRTLDLAFGEKNPKNVGKKRKESLEMECLSLFGWLK